MVRRSLALLALLTGAAGFAYGLLVAANHDCRGLRREFALSAASIEVCGKSLGCHFDYADLKAAARQQLAVQRCEADR